MAGAACVLIVLYTGFYILLIMFPALAVFGPSVLLILPVLAALIQYTVILEYRNTLSTSSIQNIEPKHALHQVCTGSSIHYPQIDIVNTDLIRK